MGVDDAHPPRSPGDDASFLEGLNELDKGLDRHGRERDRVGPRPVPNRSTPRPADPPARDEVSRDHAIGYLSTPTFGDDDRPSQNQRQPALRPDARPADVPRV